MPNLAVANTKSVNEAGFGISSMGGHTYGTNGIGVWLSGRIHVGLSDTIDTDFAGAGVVEAWLSPDHLKQAKEIQAQLCKAAVEDPKNEVDPVEPNFVYSVDCLEDGQLKTHQGKLYELPKSLCFLLTDYYRSMLTAYAKEGRAIAKISVNVESVVQQKEKFLASIVYRNSGDFPMKMFMPDRWAEFGDKLEIGGVSADGKDRWEASLADLPLVNKADFAEFSDGIITIPAGGSVTFKYLTVPDRKIKRGTYKFNALTFVSIGGEGVVATMGKVDFRSDRSKPTRATF
ncbi:hypothetical protein, partial [Caballeronia sordidicola]|uniref:hypothetical protein n=1 Tax=Caballeronia sordidicola TaxID=196367 RepID=UPI0012FE4511